MPHRRRETLHPLKAELAPLAGLWHGIEADLHAMGINVLADLRGLRAGSLTASYCALAGRPFDPALQPCFAALIAYSETGIAKPWWRVHGTPRPLHGRPRRRHWAKRERAGPADAEIARHC
jgi:hypothetical protein